MSDLLQRIAGLSPDKRALLAQRLKERSRGAGGVRIAPRDVPADDVPLSFGQQRLWFLDQLEAGSAAYNMPAVVRLDGALNVRTLERSLGEVVRRHESLRTTFAVRHGEPFQVIVSPRRLQLPLVDLTACPEPSREAAAEALAVAAIRRPFDLARGPLFRPLLVRLATRDHLLVMTIHHIVADGWSIGVLFEELASLYGAFAAGEPSPLPEPPVQYADFAVWQRRMLRGGELDAQLAYWRQALAGAPTVLELPKDRPWPPRQSFRGTFGYGLLPPPLAGRLRALGQRHDATLFMTLLAAFAALLGAATGQRDILVGSPVAGRDRVELEGLIGFFANMLVLRTDLTAAPRFGELLAVVRESLLGAFSHQDVPFEKLVEELRPERHLSHTPLCQVVFAFQNAPGGGLRLPGLELQRLPMETGTAIFELMLSVQEEDEGLRLLLQYNTDLFDGATAARVLEHLRVLLEAAVDNPDRPVAELPQLTAAERHQLAVEWNDTRADLPGLPVHRLVEAQAARSPAAVAVSCGGATTTYAELDRRANRLADRLARLGAGPEVFVGLYVERCPDMLVAMLAILKTGAAYVPLDPRYPRERVAFMLEDTRVAVLVTQGPLVASLPEHRARVVLLDQPDQPDATAVGGEIAPELRGTPESVAYVIYTSGSTGRPKGVAIRHRGVTNLLQSCARLLDREDLAGMLAATSICFDLSVFEIFLPWTVGGTVVLAADALHLSALPEAGEVTLVNTVPSVAVELVRMGALPASLRSVVLAGEPLRRALVEQLVAARPGLRVFNFYAPSETTTYSTCRAVGLDREPSIGRPIGNTSIHLLDAGLRPVPCGVVGELCIGGDGVARGYVDRPQQTAERFVPDPFSLEPGARVYRTGDFARALPDGDIELLGRRDDQVKIRGFRIELGEIEAALGRCAGVGEAVVVVREDVPGDRRLVAYVVPAPDGTPTLSSEALRAWLRERLPEHMVPALIAVLTALPRTPNGKVDRRSLPPPERERSGERPATASPQSPAEELLAGIWASLLGIAPPGGDESFFDLGGHSLLATRMVSRLREVFGVVLPLHRVFELPTVASMARALEVEMALRSGHGGPALRALAEGAEAPLSFGQQRLWSLVQVTPEASRAYHLPLALRLRGDLDAAALERGLGEVVRRQGALRTTFRLGGHGPVQVIAPPVPLALPLVDLRGLPEVQRATAARRLAAVEAERPFDLARGPLVRATLLLLGGAEHDLLLTLHHIIADGWSLGVLWDELAAFYAALSDGEPAALPELPVQYTDFARWQRDRLQGELLEAELAYWRQQLAGAPRRLELPTDHPRPVERTFAGAVVPFAVECGGALRALSREQGATLFMTLVAAFGALLLRYTGQRDLVVGAPIAGRTRSELEGLIGLFVDLLALRLDLSADPSFIELVARTRRICLAAYAHQELPFERLIHDLSPERAAGRLPLIDVVFTLQNAGAAEPRLSGLEATVLEGVGTTAKFDLALGMAETEEGLKGWLEYDADLFDEQTVVRLAGHLRRLLEGAAAVPAERLSRLPLLSEAETWCLLGEWGRSVEETAPEGLVHELFEALAARAPHALAVEDGQAALTYDELDRRADDLAGRLTALGVGVEVPVAVCLERSPELVIAAVATAKAGGVYLPLDPRHPAERLLFMLRDGAPAVVLSRSGLADRLRPSGVRILCLDETGERVPPRVPAVGGRRDVGPRHLAYAIYTSGSTGVPKAAALEHGGLARLVSWSRGFHEVGPGARWTLLSAPGFDASVWEIWGALAAGASLHVPAPELLASPAGLLEWMAEHGVTHSFLTTPLAEALLAEGLPPDIGLRVLLTGGAKLGRAPARPLPFRFVNHYGPTEATIVAICSEVRPGTSGAPPIGRPLAAARAYLLDAQMGLVPAGVTGEIYLGGGGVARAYLARPDLTAERFVPDPFAAAGGEPGSRLYRTGDLARWRPDGDLEFIGRLDDQVKIRGYRIEPGEIETALKRHPAVREAVVVTRSDRHREPRLVAYVAAGEAERPRERDLRDALRAMLPEYMIPADIVVLATLPLDANGKVDRRALPEPERTEPEPGELVAPRTSVEARLAAIWCEVLGISDLGMHDDFFDLGGDSILSIQIVARANRAGLRITPKQLFERPSIAELATVVESSADALDPGEQGRITGTLPLAPIQAWFFERDLPQPGHFNQSLLVTMEEPCDLALLERAIAALFAHHDALRLRFERDGAGWRQEHDDRAPAPRFVRCDLSAVPPPMQSAALEEAAARLQAGLDLGRAPLATAAVFDLGVGEPRRLLLVVHHLVIDAVSWRILLEDLESAYRRLLRGELPEPPPKTTSFKRWALRLVEHARSGALDEELAWWCAEPRGRVAPLPRRDAAAPDTVASSGAVTATLDRRATRALLQEVPQAFRARIDEALLAALALAFAEWTGERSLLVDLEGHGREDLFPDVDLSRTVGWFTTLFPVLVTLPPTADPGAVLDAVKAQLRAVPGRGIGHGLLRYAAGRTAAERLRELPQPEVSLNYLGQFDQAFAHGSLFRPAPEPSGPEVDPRTPRAHLFEINAMVLGGQLRVTWTYGERAHRRADVEALCGSFMAALCRLVERCPTAGTGRLTPSDVPLAALGQEQLDRLPYAAREVEDVYPLAPAQQGMLFHSVLTPDSPVYFLQLRCALHGELDPEAFAAAWQQVVERHPALRTAFAWRDLETPRQVVVRGVRVPFEAQDWRDVPEAEQRRRLASFLRADRSRGFDLSRAPLMRLALLRTADDTHQLLWSYHHLLADGWCLSRLLKEVFALHAAVRRGEALHLPLPRPTATTSPGCRGSRSSGPSCSGASASPASPSRRNCAATAIPTACRPRRRATASRRSGSRPPPATPSAPWRATTG